MDCEWTLLAVALFCCESFFLIKWNGQKENLKRKLQSGRQKRQAGFKLAEQAVNHFKAENYTHEVIGEWNKLQLDVLLCPILGPAINFTYSGRLTSGVSYTALYNLLNFPVGVIPITTVTAEDEDQLRHYKGIFGSIVDKLLFTALEGGVALPIAVQCVSLPWQDEFCLRLMRELEALCAKKKQSDT